MFRLETLGHSFTYIDTSTDTSTDTNGSLSKGKYSRRNILLQSLFNGIHEFTRNNP